MPAATEYWMDQASVRQLLSREELVEVLTGLSRVLWVSPDVIAEVLRKVEGTKP